MKRTIKLTESNLRKMIEESVKRALKETTYYGENLPEILENMADYARQCLNNGEDLSDYYREIVNTGLFHDSEGKTVDYDSNTNMLRTTGDY